MNMFKNLFGVVGFVAGTCHRNLLPKVKAHNARASTFRLGINVTWVQWVGWNTDGLEFFRKKHWKNQ